MRLFKKLSKTVLCYTIVKSDINCWIVTLLFQVVKEPLPLATLDRDTSLNGKLNAPPI